MSVSCGKIRNTYDMADLKERFTMQRISADE